ncbi:hypothetical protein CUJ83_13975 [Methanocella sp. CWC-04]|uniref:Glycosyl transferase family 1 domain-containing protein n=1 Tax=Methanooceanicella nereidis TaxID=2052831 RepID=A0AAP2RFG8_9EURY|nr:glycosyltransferase [Methanocella sp. CWC-04]MCD1296107.1 hypothetical protein [Methanocella sp. CWC-04]
MRYLMVSTYPPKKCGIGKYAYQMVQNIKKDGELVDIISLNKAEDGLYMDLKGGRKLLGLSKYINNCDKTIIQYHESFYHDSSKNLISNILTYLSFYYLFIRYGRKIEVIAHEISYDKKGFYKFLECLKWGLCPNILFHTQKEIDTFISHYFKLQDGKYHLIDHSKYFIKYTNLSKSECRNKFGLPSDKIIFLCIGFIQEHKGFDVAANCFKKLENNNLLLYIVGSVRIKEEPYLRYWYKLKNIVESSNNVKLVDSFVSDKEFDEWINASDIILIPYKEIWSSSVLARAKLYNKPVICRNVGGLEEQLNSNDITFNTDNELMLILTEFEKSILNKII